MFGPPHHGAMYSSSVSAQASAAVTYAPHHAVTQAPPQIETGAVPPQIANLIQEMKDLRRQLSIHTEVEQSSLEAASLRRQETLARLKEIHERSDILEQERLRLHEQNEAKRIQMALELEAHELEKKRSETSQLQSSNLPLCEALPVIEQPLQPLEPVQGMSTTIPVKSKRAKAVPGYLKATAASAVKQARKPPKAK